MKILEMPYINYFNDNEQKMTDFDFEFEGKNKDGIIDFIASIFSGKKVKDKYGNILQLKTYNDKQNFMDALKNSSMFKMSVKNLLSTHEQTLLSIIMNDSFFK